MPRFLVAGIRPAILFSLAVSFPALADPPELASWIRNTTGATGYAGLPANVQLVQYSTSAVYVSASGIPAYAIGPWGRDPNTPSDQKWVFKIPRSPPAATPARTAPPLGRTATLVNAT